MSTPSILAQLPTAGRRQAEHTIRRSQLSRAAETTGEQYAVASRTLHAVNDCLERGRARAQKLDRLIALYPYSPEQQEDRAAVGNELAALEGGQRHAAALSAAARVVHESARLELAWFDRPRLSGSDVGPAELLNYGSGVVQAPGYSVTVLNVAQREKGEQWRRDDYGLVRRRRARDILAAWADKPDTYLLGDREGRLFVARSSSGLELVPTDLAPPATEGEALRAALAVYGYPAYDNEESGFTWLVVPAAPGTSEDDTHAGLHFRISSGEHAARPASAHDEPWGASLYNHGDYITTLDAAPAGSTVAEDCAHIARCIANYSPADHAPQ
ncbi:hypothetical protein [Streptomyces virginiae]|uniref:hypothetical protein n=1 Tax=Streptomyces virginiae TaxID=1961 RepID=UPI00365B1495